MVDMKKGDKRKANANASDDRSSKKKADNSKSVEDVEEGIDEQSTMAKGKNAYRSSEKGFNK